MGALLHNILYICVGCQTLMTLICLSLDDWTLVKLGLTKDFRTTFTTWIYGLFSRGIQNDARTRYPSVDCGSACDALGTLQTIGKRCFAMVFIALMALTALSIWIILRKLKIVQRKLHWYAVLPTTILAICLLFGAYFTWRDSAQPLTPALSPEGYNVWVYSSSSLHLALSTALFMVVTTLPLSYDLVEPETAPSDDDNDGEESRPRRHPRPPPQTPSAREPEREFDPNDPWGDRKREEQERLQHMAQDLMIQQQQPQMRQRQQQQQQASAPLALEVMTAEPV